MEEELALRERGVALKEFLPSSERPTEGMMDNVDIRHVPPKQRVSPNFQCEVRKF
jgi:hypothetical protein